jgi:hypothetical protein
VDRDWRDRRSRIGGVVAVERAGRPDCLFSVRRDALLHTAEEVAALSLLSTLLRRRAGSH